MSFVVTDHPSSSSSLTGVSLSSLSVHPLFTIFLNNISQITEQILTKFHRIDPLVILTENYSKIWNPCKILVTMATKRKKNKKN